LLILLAIFAFSLVQVRRQPDHLLFRVPGESRPCLVFLGFDSRATSLLTDLFSFRSKATQVPHKFCGGFQPQCLRELISGHSVFRCTEFLPAPITLAPGCVSGLCSSRQQARLVFLFACVCSSVASLK
jgi:hypothetical protein